MKVYIRHARSPDLKYCSMGVKKFFDKHGLDMRDFLINGIDSEKLLALDDAMATAVVEVAIKEQNGQQ